MADDASTDASTYEEEVEIDVLDEIDPQHMITFTHAEMEAYGENSEKLITFTLAELEAYTENFKDSLGRGQYSVYKGSINGRGDPSLDGRQIAVKVSDKSSKARAQWLAEITHLPTFDHPNIIRLLGKCETSKRLFLIYPWMEKGDLRRNISALDWRRTVDVLLATGSAIWELHSHAPPLIYRDLKPANILIDENWNALLCDFGMVGRADADISGGTPGHTKPEVFGGNANEACDVYSFGMLILQLIMKAGRVGEGDNHVASIALDLLESNSNYGAVHQDLIDTGCSATMARRLTELGLSCLDNRFNNRNNRYSSSLHHRTIYRVLQELYGLESSGNPTGQEGSGLDQQSSSSTGSHRKGAFARLFCFKPH